MSWIGWRRYFEHNQRRPLPTITEPPGLAPARRCVLIWSLARFQLGASGEGRMARDIWRARWRSIDDDYRVALGLFVKEEGRHARVLAAAVCALGGELLAGSWSERVFRLARRAPGTRTKLLALALADHWRTLRALGIPVGHAARVLGALMRDGRGSRTPLPNPPPADGGRGPETFWFRPAFWFRSAFWFRPGVFRSPPPVCGWRVRERADLASRDARRTPALEVAS